MATLVERLREYMGPPVALEAADRIEQLVAAAERLLQVIAEPDSIVREHFIDNAVQAMADAIEAAKGGGS